MDKPRLLQTLLVDGTIEGVRIIDCETTVNAIVIPRLKLSEAISVEGITRPAFYFLINSEGDQAYIGESENFLKRVKDHDQNKDWWEVVVAFVSSTNDWSKGDVKYLEAIAVERAQNGSIRVQNIVSPVRNNISRFSVHKLQNVLDDAELILTSLNFDILVGTKLQDESDTWSLHHKGLVARGEYRGSQFVVLAGSQILPATTDSWKRDFPKLNAQREILLEEKGVSNDGIVTVTESMAFKSVSMAAGIVTGGHINGWKAWKNSQGKTMDEVMRK